jgi:hypothetical protein
MVDEKKGGKEEEEEEEPKESTQEREAQRIEKAQERGPGERIGETH